MSRPAVSSEWVTVARLGRSKVFARSVDAAGGMLMSIKREWHLLRDTEPGRRFRGRYRRTRRGGPSFAARVARSPAVRVMLGALGALLLAVVGYGLFKVLMLR